MRLRFGQQEDFILIGYPRTAQQRQGSVPLEGNSLLDGQTRRRRVLAKVFELLCNALTQSVPPVTESFDESLCFRIILFQAQSRSCAIAPTEVIGWPSPDRKSTRLNS